jgi:hypothetical protein
MNIAAILESFRSCRKRREVGVFERKARALLTPPRDAQGQPVKIDEIRREIDEIRRELALKFATDGAPVTGRVLLESDSTRARSLEGRVRGGLCGWLRVTHARREFFTACALG